MAAAAVQASGSIGVPNSVPRCVSCGYDLRGLKVEASCPECGRAIWDSAAPGRASGVADTSFALGLASIVFVFLIGPFAVLIAIPAVLIGRRARARLLAGEIPVSRASAIRTGLLCAWIGLAVSGTIIAVYLVVLLRVLHLI